jgi:integration host factor subunit alpha
MAGKSVTREDLYEAARRKVGLSAHECKVLVEQVFDQITSCLVGGETVKLSGFGLFSVRQKGQRLGRNPKTGEPAPISARRWFHLDPPLFLRTS